MGRSEHVRGMGVAGLAKEGENVDVKNEGGRVWDGASEGKRSGKTDQDQRVGRGKLGGGVGK